ncbi:Arabinose-binding domain of AraC transcription regulator, N-term [Cohaesibacter sp. ES.047]|uniref:helix-turn-helix domain-containing protein n=1 Tax=Cohaesibacter sp. ES.047 TaxID=1798205 RepID=UPI000BB924FC|nr:AraC family transcriptional regulator [Cohaesibacter sp. ES.047]SNY91190.1 Arabinose-binding domain of AraC transcription regulator, N-term [Cohaesibacter sp. ES.047]
MSSLKAQSAAALFDALVDLALKENLISASEAVRFHQATVRRQDSGTISQIEEKLFLDLRPLLVERWGGPEVGAVLALGVDLSRLGTIGELILRSETPRSAFYQLSRFNRLLYQRSSFEILNTPHRLIMTHKHASSEEKATPEVRFGTIWALANVALIPEQVFGTPLFPISTSFDFPAPDNLEPIHRVFGSAVLFNQSSASITFDQARLKDIRNPISVALFTALESVAEKALDQIPALDSVAAYVRHHVKEQMAGAVLPQSAVASLLGMSVRSLQRRLMQEDISFRQIVDDVRAETARHLLADDRISLSEVAFRLGYSEQAAFNHAATRWFGTSPRAMRKTRTNA